MLRLCYMKKWLDKRVLFMDRVMKELDIKFEVGDLECGVIFL